MGVRGSTTVVLAVGSAIALGGVVLRNPIHGVETWLGLASIYLTACVFLGTPRIAGLTKRTSFTSTFFVALASMLVPLVVRVWGVIIARPELRIYDALFVVWQLHILIPLVVAFMLPLGIANRRTESLVALSTIVFPFIIATARGIWLGLGFGSMFVVVYYVAILLAGSVLGSVTYAYGHTLRGSSV